PEIVHGFRSTSRARFLNFHTPDGGFADHLRARNRGEPSGFDSIDVPAGTGPPATDAVFLEPGDGERLVAKNRVATIKVGRDELADDLAARNADVELGQMMGMPAIKRSGKMIGGFSNNESAMVFKLPDEAAREQALALDGAHLFDPSGGRRAPMKEWVVVPA